MQVIEEPALLTAWARSVRERGETIAFVPTMGFLHEGHLSLMREARKRGQHLVVSIFVNPLQFAPGEDLERYPQDLAGDAAKCREIGVDVLFLPSPDRLYPEGFQTRVQVGPLASGLCGASRDGHFSGVATVVLKLLNLVRPTTAVFGSKDYQQLQVIRRMVRDFDLDIEILGMPIVREPDGLAMSSRNAYLSPSERSQASVLQRALGEIQGWVDEGTRQADVLLSRLRGLVEEQPLARIDYITLVDAETLAPIDRVENRPILAALAVRFGTTRLIDNSLLRPGERDA
ncbi:MAG: pantoate--beta-alanine ligase [Myxococcota bacterium]|nr:pantoate--beta-alanine ligase [Myxococcota bacterium]